MEVFVDIRLVGDTIMRYPAKLLVGRFVEVPWRRVSFMVASLSESVGFCFLHMKSVSSSVRCPVRGDMACG